jgi:DNA-binding GntR family transcriptional regulator
MWGITGRSKLTLEEHDVIMDAIRAGDPKRASSLMRDHILSGRSAISGQFEQQTPFEPETVAAALVV